MAKGRFKSISVSETVYNKLKEIATRRGFSTLSDTVAYLVSLEELVLRRLESITTTSGNVTSSSGKLPATEVNQVVETNTRTSGNITTTSGNITNTSTAKQDSSIGSSTKGSTTNQSNSTGKYRRKQYKKQYEDDSWVLQYVPEDLENR
ncbi:MAG: hypothetical protein JHC33_15185 [Ignisphaera sp.]|nr:hypothetical protein [Ignisphaera sp.]